MNCKSKLCLNKGAVVHTGLNPIAKHWNIWSICVCHIWSFTIRRVSLHFISLLSDLTQQGTIHRQPLIRCDGFTGLKHILVSLLEPRVPRPANIQPEPDPSLNSETI